MKATTSRIAKTLTTGANLTCADNTGAKKLQIISVRTYKGRRRRMPIAGVGSVVMCRVITGDEKIRHQIVKAVVIRQRKEYRRANGIRICFEDNAAIIINDKNEPEGKLIKGPVAKEAVERFSTIGKIANMII